MPRPLRVPQRRKQIQRSQPTDQSPSSKAQGNQAASVSFYEAARVCEFMCGCAESKEQHREQRQRIAIILFYIIW